MRPILTPAEGFIPGVGIRICAAIIAEKELSTFLFNSIL